MNDCELTHCQINCFTVNPEQGITLLDLHQCNIEQHLVCSFFRWCTEKLVLCNTSSILSDSRGDIAWCTKHASTLNLILLASYGEIFHPDSLSFPCVCSACLCLSSFLLWDHFLKLCNSCLFLNSKKYIILIFNAFPFISYRHKFKMWFKKLFLTCFFFSFGLLPISFIISSSQFITRCTYITCLH